MSNTTPPKESSITPEMIQRAAITVSRRLVEGFEDELRGSDRRAAGMHHLRRFLLLAWPYYVAAAVGLIVLVEGALLLGIWVGRNQ